VPRAYHPAMPTLLPKLILTPLLVGGASLAQRRWGAQVSGWIVALPLTSGPIILFVALDQSPALAANVASGALAGVIAGSAFCLAYASTCVRTGTAGSLAAGASAFVITGLLMPELVPPLTFAAGLMAIAVVLRLLPTPVVDPLRVPVDPPAWDVPARIIVATTLVLALTTVAPIIGGRAAGIVATFPVYASVLTTFAQRTRGPAEAVAVLRGLLYGLPGFATFCLVVGALLPAVSVVGAFGAAIAAALMVQGVTLLSLMRPGGAGDAGGGIRPR
jgi:hypothetical protein